MITHLFIPLVILEPLRFIFRPVCFINRVFPAPLDSLIKYKELNESTSPQSSRALCPWQPTSYFLFHPPGGTVNRPHCGAFVASRGEITSLWSAVWLHSTHREETRGFYKSEDSAFWGAFILESDASGTCGNTSSAWLRKVSGWSSSSSSSSTGWQWRAAPSLPVQQLHQSRTRSDRQPLTAPVARLWDLNKVLRPGPHLHLDSLFKKC